MEEQHCVHCASPRIVGARRTSFTVASRCVNCGRPFTRPLSAVLVDPATARREQLLSLLRGEGIRVVPVNQVANIETWPVADVLVTYVAHSMQWWMEARSVHVILLADTDDERALARSNGATLVVASGDTAALLSLLRTIAGAIAAPG